MSTLEFHHPFLNQSLRGAEAYARFWSELECAAGRITVLHQFEATDAGDPSNPWNAAQIGGAQLGGTVWEGRWHGEQFQGVMITKTGERAKEIRVLMRPLPVVRQLRDAMRESMRDELPGELWALPPGTDTSVPSFDRMLPVDPHFPVPISDDLVFHTPVFKRPVEGAALVKQAVGHATAAYGGRTYGTRLLNGRRALTQWEGTIAGLPLHAANLSTVDDHGRMSDLAVFMAPVPTVELFLAHLTPRVRELLGPEYFES